VSATTAGPKPKPRISSVSRMMSVLVRGPLPPSVLVAPLVILRPKLSPSAGSGSAAVKP
jgi:hypothetical protein